MTADRVTPRAWCACFVALAVLSAALVATVVSTATGPDRADALVPGEIGPGSTGYTVTIAARFCPQYTDVRANRARNNIMESLKNLGPDTNYSDGEALTVAKESEAPQSNCAPLNNWRFTFGDAIVGGDPANPSVVLNPDPTTIVTQSSVPERDKYGNVTGASIAGATTIELTPAQVERSQHRGASPGGLWIQGGTPTDPLNNTQFPGQFGFAALRCAIDNLNGDNVEWISYPEDFTHVLCFAYYVQPPPTAGTIVVRKELTAGTDTASFPFSGTVSYEDGGHFALDVVDGAPASQSFIRSETEPGDAPWVVAEDAIPGWQASGPPTCTAPGGSTVVTAPASVSITLVAGDTVTCTFTNQRFVPGVFQVLKQTVGTAGGPFAFTVTPPPAGAPQAFSVTTADPDTPVAVADFALPGSYTVAEALPPALPGGSWALTDVSCNGVSVPFTNNSIIVNIVATTPQSCVFTNTFTPLGSITIRKVTHGGVGEFRYIITPVSPQDLGTPPLVVSATTAQEGVPVTATGDDLTGLPLGEYNAIEIEPPSSPAGVWRSVSLVCDPNNITIIDDYSANGTLTAADPNITCTVENQLVPPGTLQVVKQVAGDGAGRTGPVSVEAACPDGNVGTLTLPSSEPGPAQLDPPLTFLAPSTCTVTETATGVAPGATVATSFVITSNGTEVTRGDGPIPDVAVAPGTAVVVTITDTYTAPLAPTTTTSGPDVAGVGLGNDGGGGSGDGSLPFTGSTPDLLLWGLATAALGGAVIAGVRRRRAADRPT